MLKEPQSFVLAAIAIVAVLLVLAAKLLVPVIVEVRPSSVFARLHEREDWFDWAMNLSFGATLASALSLMVIPSLTFSKPLAGTLIGIVSSVGAYVIAQPPRRQPGEPRIVDVLRFVLSSALLVLIGIVLAYLIWTDPTPGYRN